MYLLSVACVHLIEFLHIHFVHLWIVFRSIQSHEELQAGCEWDLYKFTVNSKPQGQCLREKRLHKNSCYFHRKLWIYNQGDRDKTCLTQNKTKQSKTKQRLPHASVIAALFCLQINKDVIYCKLKLTPVTGGINGHDKLTQCMHCLV